MLSTIDVAIIAAFLCFSAYSGLRVRKIASENLEEYFLAGRSLPGWKAGISMAATQFAADTPLLVTGLIATAGLFSLWRLWIYALAFLLLGFVLAGPWRRASVLTDAELAELRYGSRLALVLRVAKALYFGTLFNCTVLAMVLFAAARIAEPFLPWQQWLPAGVFSALEGVVRATGLSLSTSSDPALWAQQSASNFLSLGVVVLVTLLYSTTGGLRAVVNTDVAQFAIAMLATAIYAWVVVAAVGGLGALPQRIADLYGAARSREILALTPGHAADAGALVLGTMAVQWLAQMNADGTGYLAQRTMACRSERDARQAAVVFTVAQIVLRSLLWIPIGLGLLVLFPMLGDVADVGQVAAREGTFVTGIAQYLPAGVKGLMLTGLIAALASTLDTHLNWGASYWTNDLYKRLCCQIWRKREASGRELVWVARASNLLILLLATLILTRLDSIQSAWQASLLLGAGMGVPLVLRWLWWRMTALAELSAIVVSSMLVPVLLAWVDSDGARLLAITACSTSVVLLVASLGKREPLEHAMNFYRQVRPPGFWGPVAQACGSDVREPVRRLSRGLLFTFLTALCLFCILVAAVSALFGSPAPCWFPWHGAWITLLLSCGVLGLVLLWKQRSALAAG